jgi:bifunctional UDP-N-acetylglucosamine pyrophosphorylase/glucosamine-1-phosphate N-acetyltransferase
MKKISERKKGEIKIVILAAGKGKRMQSELPKVLARIRGKAMIKHLLESVEDIVDKKIILVVGHKMEMVQKELGDKYLYVWQKEQLGTGHALSCAKENCKDTNHIVVLQGDQPFISKETVQKMIEKHLKSGAKITFTSVEVPDFENWRGAFMNFGRILRKNGKITGIRESKDATVEEKGIKEVNAGCYVFEAKWLWENLKKIKNENSQKEYYLVDLIHIAATNNDKIENIKIDPKEALGANSQEELDILESFVIQ